MVDVLLTSKKSPYMVVALVDSKKQCFFFIVFFNLEMIKKIKNKRTKKKFLNEKTFNIYIYKYIYIYIIKKIQKYKKNKKKF